MTNRKNRLIKRYLGGNVTRLEGKADLNENLKMKKKETRREKKEERCTVRGEKMPASPRPSGAVP